jgi:membrane protease YdiL (CAAX protease family)
MSASSVPLARAWTAIAAGVIAFGMDALYIAILHSEGEGDLHRARAQLIAASLAVSGAVALAGWLVRDPRLRLALLAAAAFTLLVWGILGILSIGLPVFAAGILLLVTASHAADEVSTKEGYAITVVAGVSVLVLVGVILKTTS